MFDSEPTQVRPASDYYGGIDSQMPPRNKAKQITIEPLDRGFVAQVGCQTFAFVDKAEFIEKLTKYLDDPNGTERAWFNGELF